MNIGGATTINLQTRAVRLYRLGALPRLFAYTFLKCCGVEIPRSVRVGRRITLAHGASGLVIHPNTWIGDDVRLYQGVTIGRADIHNLDPIVVPAGEKNFGAIIEDGVIICANAVVLFSSVVPLRVGERSVVGANSVVLRDVPDDEIWAGNPARRLSGR